MKESHVKGLAAHSGPESCGGVRKDIVEALTGVRAGRVFSRERQLTPGCRRCRSGRKATLGVPLSRGTAGPRAVRDPVHVRKHLAREPGDPTFTAPDLPADLSVEALAKTEAMAKAGGRAGRIGKSKDARR